MSGKIILVQDRQDNYHLVDFCAISGRKYTLCDLVYDKKHIINTLTIDDVFDGICTNCKEIYERDLSIQAVGNRKSKGALYSILVSNYTQARDQISDKELGYQDRKNRIWDKLGKYKRKLKVDQRK